MPKKSQLIGYPDRKISETFLHYAEPLLEVLGPDSPPEQMEECLKIAFTIWNAVVYEKTIGDTRYIDMLNESMESDPEKMAILSSMIARKRQDFGDDHRVIGNYKLTSKGDELRLKAEARTPWPSN
ncbi:MAG: hypothetical protein JXM70_19550 [Pirellulales bacterium]|nr:hypothetical protein [Pirellulales bacterium]